MRQFSDELCPLSFLQGRAYLALGEYSKARASFLHAAAAFTTPQAEILWELLAPVTGDQPMLGLYYAKVMRMFDSEIPARFSAMAESEKPALCAQVILL